MPWRIGDACSAYDTGEANGCSSSYLIPACEALLRIYFPQHIEGIGVAFLLVHSCGFGPACELSLVSRAIVLGLQPDFCQNVRKSNLKSGVPLDSRKIARMTTRTIVAMVFARAPSRKALPGVILPVFPSRRGLRRSNEPYVKAGFYRIADVLQSFDLI